MCGKKKTAQTLNNLPSIPIIKWITMFKQRERIKKNNTSPNDLLNINALATEIFEVIEKKEN